MVICERFANLETGKPGVGFVVCRNNFFWYFNKLSFGILPDIMATSRNTSSSFSLMVAVLSVSINFILFFTV